jgi:hypothetical protein
VDEERLASQSLVENLMDKFGTKPIVKENQVNGGDDGSAGGTGTIGEIRNSGLKYFKSFFKLIFFDFCVSLRAES